MDSVVIPLKWTGSVLQLLDQRSLPHEEKYQDIGTIEECYDAIRDMVVRGAPLIGLTAIYGMLLWLKKNEFEAFDQDKYKMAGEFLKGARPTAVNLKYEIDRCLDFSRNIRCFKQLYIETEKFVSKQSEFIKESNLKMAKFATGCLGGKSTKKKFRLMTLCNTGELACGPVGTALGAISYLAEAGMVAHVFASETRPYLQGARLTSYELMKRGISHQIVVEGAASYLMSKGLVDAIFVGADRIVRNGDVANKVGTSSLSIIAKRYDVPFYVVAPSSSFDLDLKEGSEIEIELRDENEILFCGDNRIAPQEVHALNPSFDVTQAEFITAIICQQGVISPVNMENLLKVLQ